MNLRPLLFSCAPLVCPRCTQLRTAVQKCPPPKNKNEIRRKVRLLGTPLVCPLCTRLRTAVQARMPKKKKKKKTRFSGGPLVCRQSKISAVTFRGPASGLPSHKLLFYGDSVGGSPPSSLSPAGISFAYQFNHSTCVASTFRNFARW